MTTCIGTVLERFNLGKLGLNVPRLVFHSEKYNLKTMFTNSKCFLKSIIWYLIETEFTSGLKGETQKILGRCEKSGTLKYLLSINY